VINKIKIINFKKLKEDTIELDQSVVFVGPNNSGKTSALQAISLWELGMRKWVETRRGSMRKQKTGVTINRRDIITIPVPSVRQLWSDLEVRKAKKSNQRRTEIVYMSVLSEGFTDGKDWKLGFEFNYANPEFFYCRIMQDEETKIPMEFPEVVLNEKIGYLTPLSGLAAEEDKLEIGSIRVKIGEGRTAEVLRNLCYIVYSKYKDKWDYLAGIIEKFFYINIEPPKYEQSTGRITMTYKDKESGKRLDISCGGRGFHQILLLFSYIYSGVYTILLIDEPDSHLEIIRQRENYNLLSESIKKEKSQLIIATHSEAVLNEAADKDKIIAFLRTPHLLNDKSQLVKSLTTIGFEQYYLAKQNRWVLYLEGSTDLLMLRAFAELLKHPVKEYLDEPFVKYVGNIPGDARNHFFAIQREAYPEFLGIAIFDNMNMEKLQGTNNLTELMWEKREIENYLPVPEVLNRYSEKKYPEDLFTKDYPNIMNGLIKDYIAPAFLNDKTDSWWNTVRMSEILDKIFRKYFEKIGTPVWVSKSNYYELVLLANPKEIDPEVSNKLDAIMDIAIRAEET
jgi:AAA15 family ATPase/GTPase